ncbi:hypothetical protein H6F50_26090 [Coleofasciculus sp. FACHB-712]|uniref:competence protein CoiA family protein n=1 Tax=Coleofasciculus sp. FACHB-712 TaxID=2692789 RepID=UPI00168291E2|nr:competence protein CoiA family protein [Coleofasciculus sp. FACHB-712]MBD1945781.1 hypothetical protein [Coleofasciculus sp. FACHB-712]
MKSTNRIKYKYAYRAENKVLYIGDLQKTEDIKNEVFTCISCGNTLIPKLGEIRQKHFAHKHIQNCSEETYLHRLAKLIFAQEYQLCLNKNEPFYIELKIDRRCNAYEEKLGKICQLDTINKTFDLTKRYVKLDLETKNDAFIPDILLSDISYNKNLFIEIAVTHKITDKKAQSKFQIIEISIESEEDILFIKEHIISQNNPKIKLINFDIKPEQGNICNGQNCSERMGFFRVYKNGKSILTWESLPKAYFILKNHKNIILYYKIISSKEVYLSSYEYKKNLVDAYNAKVAIKNCSLCRYHGESWSYSNEEEPIFCKFLKINCNSNHASECQYFRPDPKCFPMEVFED